MTTTMHDENTAREVAAYLAELPDVTNIRPVKVTIDGLVYYGARYTQTLHYTAGMTATALR